MRHPIYSLQEKRPRGFKDDMATNLPPIQRVASVPNENTPFGPPHTQTNTPASKKNMAPNTPPTGIKMSVSKAQTAKAAGSALLQEIADNEPKKLGAPSPVFEEKTRLARRARSKSRSSIESTSAAASTSEATMAGNSADMRNSKVQVMVPNRIPSELAEAAAVEGAPAKKIGDGSSRAASPANVASQAKAAPPKKVGSAKKTATQAKTDSQTKTTPGTKASSQTKATQIKTAPQAKAAPQTKATSQAKSTAAKSKAKVFIYPIRSIQRILECTNSLTAKLRPRIRQSFKAMGIHEKKSAEDYGNDDDDDT